MSGEAVPFKSEFCRLFSLIPVVHFRFMSSVAQSCGAAVKSALQRIHKRHPGKSFALLLSGGVDTAAVLEANAQVGVDSQIPFKYLVSVVAGEAATDRPYVDLVSKKHSSFPSHIIDTNLTALLDIIPFCVKVLRTFDGMTLRNSAVIALVSFFESLNEYLFGNILHCSILFLIHMARTGDAESQGAGRRRGDYRRWSGRADGRV
jgi:hypothetical protein